MGKEIPKEGAVEKGVRSERERVGPIDAHC